MCGLAELQHVAVVIIYGEFAHAVLERIERVADVRFVLECRPQRLDVIGVEIERTGKCGFLEWRVCLGLAIISATRSRESEAQPHSSLRSSQVKPSMPM